MRLQGKCALVTGGASGIGQATCLVLAREGANVAVADLDEKGARATADRVAAAGRKALALRVEVSDPASVGAGLDRMVMELGKVDILVNCAGRREIVPFIQLTFEEWQQIVATNLTGTFVCSQAVARLMIERKQGGKIINLSSAAGLVAVTNRAAYVSTKHGVVGLTKEMALELGSHNIQVNAVAPGVVETPMTASYFGDPAIAAQVRKLHCLGRWAQPEEIANLILYLASPEADFVTGATFAIDGGFTAGKTF